MDIPVYLFTGFLESGKTSFIRDTLEDRDFINDEKTLLIVCEEGEEEYDEVELAGRKIDVVTVEEQKDLTEEFLKRCEEYYKPVRVIIEYNGMWKLDTLIKEAAPENWTVVQVLSTIDATTYEVYSQNMKSMIMEQIKQSDLIIFNRCTEETKRASYRRGIKAFNRKAQIVFEDVYGNPMPQTDEDLPYDIHADYIDLQDEDYGTWYIDAMENPKKYVGKTVHMKAVVYKNKTFGSQLFVPGRFAMTCCADDITFIGFVCNYPGADKLPLKAWVEVEAEIRCEYRKEYKGKGPVLYAKSVKPTQKAEEDLVYFN